jgi:hypothetical protein
MEISPRHALIDAEPNMDYLDLAENREITVKQGDAITFILVLELRHSFNRKYIDIE